MASNNYISYYDSGEMTITEFYDAVHIANIIHRENKQREETRAARRSRRGRR